MSIRYPIEPIIKGYLEFKKRGALIDCCKTVTLLLYNPKHPKN